jgi:elongation factor G
MHAAEMEELDEAFAGDIVAMFGIDCASGDTFTDESIEVAMSSMHVPAPVISLSVKPVDNKSQDNMSKALGRFVREDPTFHAGVDPESGQTIISGMGELHLEVYVERMKREYSVEVATGAPQVAYRETISERAEFHTTLKKQTGGSPAWPRGLHRAVRRRLPEFVNDVCAAAIPPSTSRREKGRAGGREGPPDRFPVTGVRVVERRPVTQRRLVGHGVPDRRTQGVWARPIRRRGRSCSAGMKLEVESPTEFQGAILKTVMQRRGTVVGTTEEDGFCRLEAEVPLSEMFGYATDLRSCTQGKAEFTMEFARYVRVPNAVQEDLKKEYGSKLVIEDDE